MRFFSLSAPFQFREGRSSDESASALALETLHRRVLPFILRRLKQDVLQDLPEKITQDYLCPLTPLQEHLYTSFEKAQRQAARDPERGLHQFQVLKYLCLLCSHPSLVLKPGQDGGGERLPVQGLRGVRSLENGAKCLALRQLLWDLGIGVDVEASGGGVVAPHRALLFFQHKAMLELVAEEVLSFHLPSATFLRLDGSVPAQERAVIVRRFNEDPSIDLLLLTTQVRGSKAGGLCHTIIMLLMDYYCEASNFPVRLISH